MSSNCYAFALLLRAPVELCFAFSQNAKQSLACCQPDLLARKNPR